MTNNWHEHGSFKSLSSRLMQNSFVVLMFCDLETLGFFYWCIEINCISKEEVFCDNPALSVNVWVAEAGCRLQVTGEKQEALVN